MEDILIDTDIVIEYLRNRNKSTTTLIKTMREHDVYLSSITEFELYLGTKTERHHKDLEMLFDEIDVLPFDFGCGEIAAGIWRDIQSRHQSVEIKDVFIASDAINNDVWLQTFNRKHFQGIKNLRLWGSID